MSLVAHYPFNGNALDVVGARHGTLLNGLGFSSGKFGQALHFAHDTHQVTIPHDDKISARVFGVSTQFSFTCWYRPDEFYDYGCIVTKATGGSWSSTTAALWVTNQGFVAALGSNVPSNPPDSSRLISYKPAVDQWYHVAVICDGEQLHLYVNGVHRGSKSALDLDPGRSENTSDILIGPRYEGGTSKLRGRLQDLKIYDHGLSKRELFDDLMAPTAKYDFLSGKVQSSIRGLSTAGFASGATFVPDRGFYLDGVDDYLYLDRSDMELVHARGTLSFEFEVDDVNIDQMLFFNRQNRDRGLAIVGGQLLAGLFTATEWRTLNGGTIVPGRHAAALCWDAGAGILKLFVDGQIKDTLSVSGGWATNNDSSHVTIGDPTGDTGWQSGLNWFKGYARTFRLFGEVLESHEIHRLHSTQASVHNNGSLSLPHFAEKPRRIVGRGGVYMVNGTIKVTAYEDNTVLYRNGVQLLTLSAGEIQTVTGSWGDLLTSNGKPFTTGTSTNGVPMSWASTRHAFRVDRNPWPDGIRIFSPHGEAHVKVYRNDNPTVPLYDVTIAQDQYAALESVTIHNYIVESDLPVCIYMFSNADLRPCFPPTTRLYGTPSGNSDVIALEDDTQITVYRSSGVVLNVTLNRFQSFSTGGSGAQFAGWSEVLVANKPIVANSQADADGGEATPYVSKSAMSTEFILPDEAEWVKLVGYVAGATIKVYDPTGTLTQTVTVNSQPNGQVTELRVMGPLAASTKLVCSHPQHAVMEILANDDETVLYGHTPDLRGMSAEDGGESNVLTGQLREAGILERDYHAWCPMVSDTRDIGMNALQTMATNVRLTDRGYAFREGGLSSYVRMMSPEEAEELLGAEEDGISVLISFESKESVSGATLSRMISRDASDYWAIIVDQGQTFPQEIRFYNAGTASSTVFPAKVTAGWHRAVLLKDPVSSTMRCYLDGELLGTSTLQPVASRLRGITIGCNEENGPNPNLAYDWHGRLEDAQVIKGAITEAEVMEDYRRFLKRQRTFSMKTDTLVPYRLIES